MKVQCDVCGREEASLFCCADEAALCAACDRRVHRANKLAGKHRRLPFLPSSSSYSSSSIPASPLCDVCKEKRAFVFCQEDRAILCSDCDAPIHAANQLTMRHTRFLLTGVRLSSEEAELLSSQTSHDDSTVAAKTNNVVATEKKTKVAASNNISKSSSSNSNSISDYLIKTLPGWRVEDLLVDDAATAAAAAAAAACSANVDAFFQNDELLPFLEADFDGGGRRSLAAEELSAWAATQVPQAPPPCYSPTPTASGGAASNAYYHHGQHQLGMKDVRERGSEDLFAVPQISPPSSNSKRSSAPSAWYY